MRRLTPLLLAFLLLPAAASAQSKVWVDCWHGNFNCPLDLSDVTAVWEAEGAEVVVTTELTDELWDGTIRLLVIIMPTFGLQEDPTGGNNIPPNYLSGFLAAGGRVVFLADHDGDADQQARNDRISDALDSLPDHGLSLNEDVLSNGCAGNETNMFGNHDLTAGMTAWHYAAVNTVSGGTPLIEMNRSDDGQLASLAAVGISNGGEVVLVGDYDGFTTQCYDLDGIPLPSDWVSDQAEFWRNLYTSGALIDSDGDGWSPPDDCNDDDPYVSPDEDEDCLSGVDDDCDGLVDGDDPDCGGPSDDDDATEADDDDATEADDDDTISDLPDDDDGGGVPQTSGWGCCSSDQAAAKGGSIGGFMLMGLALMRRRRV
jgi:MYXO-CTERM domain-containing protein